MPRVIIRKASYDYSSLRPLLFSIMDEIGGGEIKPGSRVLIKPNMLCPAKTEEGILTHPNVIRAAVEYVLEHGARPQVSDSSAIGSFDRIAKGNGLREALNGLPVECRDFQHSAMVDIGRPFGRIELAQEAVESDLVINLPKLKSHSAMLLTLGVKNLFGCVVGFRKAEWHMRTGIDQAKFAQLLVQIYQTINPRMTILDGITCLEGNGPAKGGRPREVGVIMASNSALAVDRTVCRMLGLEPEQLPTNREADRSGLEAEPVEIDGEPPVVRDFKLARHIPLMFGPRKYHSAMRRHLLARPAADPQICKMCGECWKFCPAQAVGEKDEALKFDYEKCIRCYCCIEVCPHGALRSIDTLPGKILSWFIRS